MMNIENRRERPLPVLALACIARPTFAVDYAGDMARQALAALQQESWPVYGDATLLMDAQSARQYALGLKERAPDVLVLLCATFSDASMAVELASHIDAPVCLWALREPGSPGERLWLNSLCGAHLAAYALHKAGRVVRYIYGDPGEAGLFAPLRALARAAATRKRLRTSRLGLVGEAPTGFYSCQFDELELARVIGTTVSRIDLAQVFKAASQAPASAVAEVIASTQRRSPSLQALRSEEVQRFGAAYVALRALLEEQHLDGLAVRCWPEFPQDFGLMPCATLGRLADDGFVCACEADLHGAVTLLMLQWLSGAAPLLADVVALNEQRGALWLWHCGNAPACLARPGEEIPLTLHCNRRIGVAGDFAIRPGPATLARLGVGAGGYRLLYVEGELLDEPVNRFAGNTAVFRPTCHARQVLDTLIAGGWEHHVAFVAGHQAEALEALAELLAIERVAL
uniref:Fucose isomerase n=1 Tax=Thermogemmatispora argillosa TaxID=2045280 RepID=A0A455SWJ2_9CHLR|nr:fucose isomerase [Thermogemmatispora argillosa]